MGRVRQRQRNAREAKRAANIRIRENANSMRMMTPALLQQDYEDRLIAAWGGSFSVLAFLFAFPEEPCITTLDLRGDYFDTRTGDTWDLFFPGYYKSGQSGMEVALGSVPVGDRYGRDWYFSSRDFDHFREHIETATHGDWTFSGAADLVLLNVWIPERGRPTVDWNSAQSGTLVEHGDRSLKMVIEKISRDIEQDAEDPYYGVGSVVSVPPLPPADGTAEKIMIGALGGILAAIGKSYLGF